ncbi:MAG TPA: tryptophan synthase subunit beta, partial [Pseudomonas sp.]|nr:tryptophan synthase subunit beta [Pseudomonas sp.]
MSDSNPIDYSAVPDARGHFGPYGGRFVSETLMDALDELERVYRKLSA